MPMPRMDMPLFITPITKAPMTAPITLPTPPEAEAPPMKQAAITSSSKPRPALGAPQHRHAHVDEGIEREPLGLDARELGRLLVAAHGIDAAADGGAAGDKVEQHDQQRHHDEHVGQALVRSEQVA